MDRRLASLRFRIWKSLSEIAARDVHRSLQVRYRDLPAELFRIWNYFFTPTSDEFCSAYNADELRVLFHFDSVLNDIVIRAPLPLLDDLPVPDGWLRLWDAADTALRDLAALAVAGRRREPVATSSPRTSPVVLKLV